MSQHSPAWVINTKTNATIGAGYVVTPTAAVAKQSSLHITSSTYILGVTLDSVNDTTGTTPVIVAGTAKCVCGASVSVGSIVSPQTDTGKVIEAAPPATNTTAGIPTLGIALESGSANGMIEVALQINNYVQYGTNS